MFLNFFLIIMALYQLKPSSRSLILEAISSDYLPYVWIGSAAVLFISIAIYEYLLEIFDRFYLVLGTAVLFAGILVVFWLFLNGATPAVAIAYYIFVDLFGVVMVEQFWSLTNSVYSTPQGKNWYGFIATGGLVGGAVGSGAAALLIKHTPVQTKDLLLVAAAIVMLIFVLTWLLGRYHIYRDTAPVSPSTAESQKGWRHLIRSRYLILIALALLMVQFVSPMVEYQFMHKVESAYPEREQRTAVLSLFFTVLSVFSIAINLIVTPFVLRVFGVLTGLLVQPVAMLMMTATFMFQPSFWTGAIMKISDRGLSYSINRASKELLYIPVNPAVMYQVKGWIDMFGYRTFKIFGALLILAIADWSELSRVIDLNWVIMLGCGLWVGIILLLNREYQAIQQHKHEVY